MDFVNWDASLELGVDIMDRQHHRLISIINEVDRTQRGEINSLSTPQLINELLDYIVEHFSTEEELMRRYEYADFAAHKSVHDAAANRLFDWNNNLGSEQQSAEALLKYLVHWIEHHLKKEDLALANFLIDKGVSNN